MRLAIAACAIALAVFAGVFGFLVINNPALLNNEPAPAPAVSAKSRPAPQTVTVVTEAPTFVTPAPVAATPVPVDTSPTVAQRSPTPEAPAFAQALPPAAANTPAAAPARAAAAPSCPGNPNAIGIARTVEIDTTGGPGFGFEHFRQHDFLRARRSRADLRRRPVAATHDGGRQRARRALHARDLLPDRQARHLRARHPQAGRRRADIRSAATPGATRTSPTSRSRKARPRSRRASAQSPWPWADRRRRSSASRR